MQFSFIKDIKLSILESYIRFYFELKDDDIIDRGKKDQHEGVNQNHISTWVIYFTIMVNWLLETYIEREDRFLGMGLFCVQDSETGENRSHVGSCLPS